MAGRHAHAHAHLSSWPSAAGALAFQGAGLAPCATTARRAARRWAAGARRQRGAALQDADAPLELDIATRAACAGAASTLAQAIL